MSVPRPAPRHLRATPVAALVLLASLVAAAPSAAVTTIGGADGPGPARYDKVFVSKLGPSTARTVLVLVPGTAGGAGTFTLVARDLVARVPGLQVWAVDRRSQALEDTDVFRAGLRGERTPQQVLDHYLGWLANPEQADRFRPLDESTVPYARDWGLDLHLRDLRRVVRSARAGGKRRVVLGGHSLGASVALAYASWDFGGRAGWRDLAGLVAIDGGLMGSAAPTPSQTREQLRALRRTSPFLDLVGLGLPWAAGVFAEVGALAARQDPTGPSVAQAFPLLPPPFRPPVPVTNRGLLGYAFDATTSPALLELIQVRAGALAPTGDPRDWVDGEVTPIARLAATFAQEPANAVEWYFPKRLSIDVAAVRALRRTRLTDELRLRPWHRRSVRVPLYAVQTSLSEGRVLRGARAFIAGSRVPRARSTLVDAAAEQSHLDPLTAAPDRNRFLRTVVPFLRRLR